MFEDLVRESALGCALCRRSRQAGDRSIAAFAYELVTDPVLRAELRRSLGFCRAHAITAAAQTGAPLAESIVCADLCAHVARLLETGRPVAASGPCPACLVAARRERHDLETIGGRRLEGVCPSHPRPVPRRDLPCGPPIGEALPVGSLGPAVRADPGEAGRQRAAYAALQRRLGDVIQHYDYRFREQPFDDFGATWEALALFSGTDPHDRPHGPSPSEATGP
ncbi:MAG TPA: hypothetical protein VGT60_06675 [Candidatus Limnocylindria bacterium]|nr:hypothetical protein [Candidatus Limnocylindria bacterium]